MGTDGPQATSLFCSVAMATAAASSITVGEGRRSPGEKEAGQLCKSFLGKNEKEDCKIGTLSKSAHFPCAGSVSDQRQMVIFTL